MSIIATRSPVGPGGRSRSPCPPSPQVRRRIDEKNKLLRAMAVNGKEAAYAVVDLAEVSTTGGSQESFTSQFSRITLVPRGTR